MHQRGFTLDQKKVLSKVLRKYIDKVFRFCSRPGSNTEADGRPEFAEWAKTDVEQSIPARFEEQVIRHGTRQAVCGESGILTYDELNRQANCIARAILDRSSGAANGVALYLAHDIMIPAAALGVLKAGHFYIPLAPGHPEDRNAFVLEDSGAEMILTDQHNISAALALAARVRQAVHVLSVEKTNCLPGDNLEVKASPHDLCFILYTSGSTGRPKGVCQLHRNILHGAAWYTNQARIGPHDRMSLLHSLSAVACATSLYAALLNGAAILPFNVREAGLGGLVAWMERERISCLHAVPTLFRRLCHHLARGRRLDDVRLVRLGGEAITCTEWRMWREHFPEHSQLFVGLGSTETLNYRQTVYDYETELIDDVVAVGDPVPDMEVLLVDANGRSVGAGKVGEIVVRSEYLFPGYWRRPELNERVLCTDPRDSRRRLFRTGDLGRFAADRRLFHAGRSDLQVKIDGYRVETAEVEQALRRFPPIRDAAVMPIVQSSKSVRLIAFAAIGGEEPPIRRKLRASLQEILPDYMIPSAFIFVEDLPLLPEGKLDRRTLMERSAAYFNPVEHVEPRNPIEETMVEIWQRNLSVSGIGIHDNLFLDLGGDSLAAEGILTEVLEIFQRELPLSSLYEANTVAQLCKCLVDSGWQPPKSGQLLVNPGGPRNPVFGICGVFGHALRLLMVGTALGPDRPFYGLQPPDMDWEQIGCLTIEAMAAHYLAQIRRIQPLGPYQLIGTSFGGVVVFEIALQLQRAGETVGLLAMVDTYPPDCLGPEGIDCGERHGWWAGMTTGDRTVEMGIRVAQTHCRALDKYVLRDRFNGTITYFWCEELFAPMERDRRSLWGSFASDGLRIFRVPGHHGNFHREPQLSAVVEGLGKCLR